MAEPLLRVPEIMEIMAPPLVAVNGPRVTFDGLENIPEHGGALIAVNHTSYLDWYPPSLAAYRRWRRLRFMIKAEMRQVPAVNFVIKQIKLIPVDRAAGADSYAVAVQRLREGELVGVHPEATISRSFELREFKTGAARMAVEAGVPIIPFIVWGAQRVWTKDHPKSLWHTTVPVVAKIGAPMPPADTVEHTNAALREAMTALLYRVQEQYPHPQGAYWVPRRLGGGAPTPEESQGLRLAELRERARKQGSR
jgi:1-acyl-sn-glycerol-3-phosphate acyltransferase